MTQRKVTKDELFLLRLYEEGLKENDLFGEKDRYEIGPKIGQNDRSVDNIVRMLAQTNFIKKGEGNAVYITEQGKRFVEEELLK